MNDEVAVKSAAQDNGLQLSILQKPEDPGTRFGNIASFGVCAVIPLTGSMYRRRADNPSTTRGELSMSPSPVAAIGQCIDIQIESLRVPE